MFLRSFLISLFLILPINGLLPGVKVNVSQTGLNYVADIIVDLLEAQVMNISIPDIGDQSASLTKIKITTFQKPIVSIVVNPGIGLSITFSKISLSLNANWQYHYKLGLIKIANNGIMNGQISESTISVKLALGMSGNGKPNLTTLSCACDINNFQSKVHGGLSWFYNILIKLFKGRITSYLDKKLCSVVSGLINIRGNSKLNTMKTQIELITGITLDYRLTNIPLMGLGYVQVGLAAIFDPSDDNNVIIQVEQHSTNRMIGAVISETVFNNAAKSIYRHGLLNRSFTIPGFETIFVLIDQNVAMIYQGASMLVDISTMEIPIFTINSSMINLNVLVSVKLSAQFSNNSVFYLLTLSLRASPSILIRLEEMKLKGHINNLTLIASVIDITFNSTGLNQISQKIGFVENNLLFFLNNLLETGVEVPNIKGFHFNNNTDYLLFGQKYFAFGGDIVHM